MENKKLCEAIEQALHRKMETPTDFEWLEDKIATTVGERLSVSTLMRLWGYREGVMTRKSTLDILARFLGNSDYAEFLAEKEEGASNIVVSRKLQVVSDLKPNDCVRLTWLPDRVCEVKYLGKGNFLVTRSEKTHLEVGDTFDCPLIIEDEPLYLDRLQHQGMTGMTYVCGKKGGVKFETIKAPTSSSFP